VPMSSAPAFCFNSFVAELFVLLGCAAGVPRQFFRGASHPVRGTHIEGQRGGSGTDCTR